MEGNSRKYIITGGPGSGKSTLVEGLEKSGYSCSAEISRQMIIAEVAKGSDCLPWLDILCFSEKVMRRMVEAWEMKQEELTFFDRGIPDVIAYLNIDHIPVPPSFLTELELHPYQNQVFILPPWEEIYVNDSERWQSFAEASLIYEAIKSTYTAFGFELIEVPRVSTAERIAFILNIAK